jgi:N-acetylneuraminic acid mutarotase
MVGNTIFVAGGTDDATTLDGSRRFWAMDLAELNPQWRELPPWPGPERFYAMAGSNGHAFYLFCGMHGVPDSAASATSAPSTASSGAAGKTHLEYLNDAYEYMPGELAAREPGTWRRLADVPHAAGAGPTPAATIDNNTLVLFGGGVDGNKEMPHTNYVYDIAKNTWTAIGPIDAVRCAVGMVPFRGGFVIPSGEYAPGKRSPEVWMYKWQPRP